MDDKFLQVCNHSILSSLAILFLFLSKGIIRRVCESLIRENHVLSPGLVRRAAELRVDLQSQELRSKYSMSARVE